MKSIQRNVFDCIILNSIQGDFSTTCDQTGNYTLPGLCV